MKYITVLDFEAGRVFQYNISVEMKTSYEKYKHWSPQTEVCEEYLTDKGHNLSNCEWMIHEDNRIVVQTPHGEMKQLQSHYDITN